MRRHSIFGEDLFDEFFDDFFDVPALDNKAMQKVQRQLYGRHGDNMMKTDVQEHEDHYEVDIDLPGFQKEELSLELQNGYLTISAAKGLDKGEEEKKTGKFVRRERFVGSVSRAFYVGDEVKQEDIHAKYENGVLKLLIPKPAEKQPKLEDRKYIAIEG